MSKRKTPLEQAMSKKGGKRANGIRPCTRAREKRKAAQRRHRKTPQSNDLCFGCRNALGGCSWSRDFEPVAGWTATPSLLRFAQGRFDSTWHITACPEYLPDEGELEDAK